MGTKIGTIWAQWVRWNSTSSTNTRHVNFAPGGRDIMAYSSLSSYSIIRSSHSHGAFGGSEPPWWASGRTGIAWYRANGQRHPNSGNFIPLRPYIQADSATEIEFRLEAGLIGDGSCSIYAVHVINYFE